MDFQINSELKFEHMLDKKGSPITPSSCANIIIKYTGLKHMRIYPRTDFFYLYDENEGYYRELKSKEVEVLIRSLLNQTGCDKVLGYAYIRSVLNNLKINDQVAYIGEPIFDKHILVMDNGSYNLKTKTLSDWSPKYFTVCRLPYSYNPISKPERFFKFLHEFCEGHEDRKSFVRAFLNCLIFSRVELQIFIYILGPGGTGKSTMALIASALVGKDSTITTTLKGLHSDNFEITNIRGKKLILISDTEHYKGDTSVLKSIVGNDALRGRMKYVQGSFEILSEGIVVIVGNYPLGVKDTTNAILRRMRTFMANTVSKVREVLIFRDGLSWRGPIAEELSGIFLWAISMDGQEVYNYLVNMNQYVASFQDALIESQDSINPLGEWAREELQMGPGSYIGFASLEGPKGLIEMARRKALYPAYSAWIKRQGGIPLTHKRFSIYLLETLHFLGFTCSKVRKPEGIYIQGIELKPGIFDRDYIYGAPIADKLSICESTQDTSTPQQKGDSPPLRPIEPIPLGKIHPRLYIDIYPRYSALFKKNDMKEEIDKYVKYYLLESRESIIQSCLETYTESCKIKSDEYLFNVERVITRGIDRMIKFGVIPYTYKQMGVSPRLIPVSYGNSINNTKKIVRNVTYKMMGDYAATHFDRCIIDLDLKSCYTSILLGLYPEHLRALQYAIEGEGLWNFIKREFESRGRSDVYNKPAVKICTYSSFFQGGNRAMLNGIMDNFRKDAGLLPKQFKDTPFYEECYNIASSVTSEMQNSSIIIDFRSVSKWIEQSYEGDYLECPTGHYFKVTPETFRSAYPNFLMSYEFALLGQATIETYDHFIKTPNNIDPIGHFHDGNVILVPIKAQAEVYEFMRMKVNQIGTSLGLKYPQDLELKEVFSKATSTM
jgi:Family of unknown function (DUF5906)/D5 N terminal like